MMNFELIFVSLIAFLGLLAGLAIAFYTKEELEHGKKYFDFMIRIMIFLIIVTAIYKFNKDYIILAIFFILGILVALLIRKNYLYLGMLLFASYSLGIGYFSIMACWIFLFGLPFGTLISFNNIKNKKKIYYIAISNFILFYLGLIVLYGPIFRYSPLIMAFGSGTLLILLIRKIV
jgi:hypothetical protein